MRGESSCAVTPDAIQCARPGRGSFRRRRDAGPTWPVATATGAPPDPATLPLSPGLPARRSAPRAWREPRHGHVASRRAGPITCAARSSVPWTALPPARGPELRRPMPEIPDDPLSRPRAGPRNLVQAQVPAIVALPPARGPEPSRAAPRPRQPLGLGVRAVVAGAGVARVVIDKRTIGHCAHACRALAIVTRRGRRESGWGPVRRAMQDDATNHDPRAGPSRRTLAPNMAPHLCRRSDPRPTGSSAGDGQAPHTWRLKRRSISAVEMRIRVGRPCSQVKGRGASRRSASKASISGGARKSPARTAERHAMVKRS